MTSTSRTTTTSAAGSALPILRKALRDSRGGLLGWLAGLKFRSLLAGVDHWVAFGLLVLIGAKMLIESFQPKDIKQAASAIDLWTLLLLALATSIDALAAGLTLALLGEPIIAAAGLIGAVAFVLSLLGGLLGSCAGRNCAAWIEALGGLILIGLGGANLIAHLYF